MTASEAAPLIEIHDVTKVYRTGEVDVPVLQDASVSILEGEMVVVLGVSGSGKTTLLNLLGALDTPTSGRILVDGEEIGGLDRSGRTDYRRRKLGFVFQFYNLLPTLTARENVMAGLEVVDLPPDEVASRAAEALAEVGLAGFEDKFPSQLSGGQQQRVAIARALARRPCLILADEPTGNLDQETGERVLELMHRLNRERGTTFVIVTHNPRIADDADRVVHIRGGRIVESAGT